MKTIKFKDLDWYVLEENEDTTKLLLKNVLDEERIKKYCEDEWFRESYEVRMSGNIHPHITWHDTYIYNMILPNFKKDLDIECEVTLLTKEEVEELPIEVRSCGEWYWTKTKIENESSSYFANVSFYGASSYYNASNPFGVRPCLILKSSILNQKEEKKIPEKLPFENGKISDNEFFSKIYYS